MITPEQANSGLLESVESVVAALYPNITLTVTSREIRLGNKGSLAVDRHKGAFFNHETGEGGDMLKLVQVARDCGFKDALEWAIDFLGNSFSTTTRTHARVARFDKQEVERNQRRIEKAQAIWRASCA